MNSELMFSWNYLSQSHDHTLKPWREKQTNKTTEKLGIISRPFKKKVHTILQEKMVFMVLQTLNIFINFYSGAISSLRD